MVCLVNSCTPVLRRFLFFIAYLADRCWIFRVCCTGDIPSEPSARGGANTLSWSGTRSFAKSEQCDSAPKKLIRSNKPIRQSDGLTFGRGTYSWHGDRRHS